MQERHRQLAAILFTDIVGYTAMMQEDEQKALQVIERYHSALRKNVLSHEGKILNDYGDGSLCTFSSVRQALRAAVGLQKELLNAPSIPLRIGLHVGEILYQGRQALGDGVNLASRIQSLGQANSILFSREVFDKIRNQFEFKSVSLGFFEFKNVSEPMEVFALANEGLTVPARSGMSGKLKDGKEKKTASSKKWLWNIPAAIILLFAAYFTYKSLTKKSDAASKRENSIAVLYFNNMSGDSTQEYFSDGITEEITSRLSKVIGLKVKSRTSVLQYKNQTKTAKTIAAELGVQKILEGSVRKQGDKFVITAQLIDGETDEHIWSDTYDRNAVDIFAVQADIAQRIAEKFEIEISEVTKKNLETAPTSNPEAYDLYLRARAQTFLNIGLGGKQPNTLKAIALLRKAIMLDSLFADAFSLLGLNFGFFSSVAQDPGQWLDSAEILVSKAIKLNPDREKGYLALAMVKNWKGKKDESLELLLKANEILPGSGEEMIAGYYIDKTDYANAGRWIEKIIEHDSRAIENYFAALSTAYYNLDMLDSLGNLIAQGRQSKPEPSDIDDMDRLHNWLTKKELPYLSVVKKLFEQDEKEYIYNIAQYYLFQRNWRIADSLYKKTLKNDDMDAGLIALQLGKKELGKKYLLLAISRRNAFLGFDDGWHLYDISRCYAALQDLNYITFLMRAIDHGWHTYGFFKADPFFDPVRNTPQFIKISQILEDRNEKFKADLKKGMEESRK